jgi:YbbR domain-containing protein
MAEKNIRKSIKKLIFNDRYLIIVSLVLAVIVWIITSLNIGDVESKTIKIQAPIKLGDEMSEQLSMQYYSLQDSIDINVTFSGAKYVIGQVDENDFKVVFDTSAVNRTGEQSIPILVTNNSNLDFTVTGTYPSSIDAYFDVNMTKSFDVEVDFDENNVAEGYVFGLPVLSEDKVIVSGPKTYVDQIERAFLTVDFGENTALTEPYKAESNIEFEGIGVESNYLTITSRTDTNNPITAVSYTIPVLKKVTLPVSVDLEDAPEGIDEGSITINYSKDSIEAGVLDSADISKAVIGTINFSKIGTGKNTFDFDVTNLKGITVLDENLSTITATVNVSSSYEYKSISIKRSDIVVEGLSDKESANVTNLSRYHITVVAPKDVQTSSLELELKVDVSERKDDNKYPITVSVLNNDNVWVFSTYTATIDIS